MTLSGYFGMLYMVCIGENCKQKNEVSGYETLWKGEVVIVILRQNRYCKNVNRNIIKQEN